MKDAQTDDVTDQTTEPTAVAGLIGINPAGHTTALCQKEEMGELLDAATHKCTRWQKRSRAELHDILADCFELFRKAEENDAQLEELKSLLQERKIKAQKNTGPAVLIIRAVFGDIGSQAFSYANVLTVAAERKDPDQTLQDFIAERGGIEKIRRGSKPRPKTPEEIEGEYLGMLHDICATEKSMPEIELPEAGAADPSGISVILVQGTGDGRGRIVFRSSALNDMKSVIKSASRQIETAQ